MAKKATLDDRTVTKDELKQVARANESWKTPVVFVHGLWLLPSSWDRWAKMFEAAGYCAVRPGWPDDPDTVEEAAAHPEVFARKSVGDIADHFEAVIRKLDRKPAVIGHSFGGLLTQILAGRGCSAVSVAIDPAPFRGVLPLPISALRSASPVLKNPANRHRAVPLTFEQFHYGFGNALERGGSEVAVREVRGSGFGRADLPGRGSKPQPLDRGEGRQQEPRPGTAADHLGRARPHGAAIDRERVVQAREAQPGDHRDRRDQGTRSLTRRSTPGGRTSRRPRSSS